MHILLKIVKEFFEKEKGIAIINPEQKINVFKTTNLTINISRKSIKHFTESRKESLFKFSKEEQLNIIIGITDNIFEILKNPDKIYANEKRKNSVIYIKKIKDKTPVSIVLEENLEKNNLEIVSIHLTKDKKYKKILSK